MYNYSNTDTTLSPSPPPRGGGHTYNSTSKAKKIFYHEIKETWSRRRVGEKGKKAEG